VKDTNNHTCTGEKKNQRFGGRPSADRGPGSLPPLNFPYQNALGCTSSFRRLWRALKNSDSTTLTINLGIEYDGKQNGASTEQRGKLRAWNINEVGRHGL